MAADPGVGFDTGSDETVGSAMQFSAAGPLPAVHGETEAGEAAPSASDLAFGGSARYAASGGDAAAIDTDEDVEQAHQLGEEHEAHGGGTRSLAMARSAVQGIRRTRDPIEVCWGEDGASFGPWPHTFIQHVTPSRP